MQVRVQRLSGDFGMRIRKGRLCNVHLEEGKVYDVEVSESRNYLVDSLGNKKCMEIALYQSENRLDFKLIDHAYSNEKCADLVIVGGKYDEGYTPPVIKTVRLKT